MKFKKSRRARDFYLIFVEKEYKLRALDNQN